MKRVKELLTQLNTENFKDRYPLYDPADGKVHVLFLSPFLDASGYYRMILPALELNRTQTHRAIVSHIHKPDFTKKFDDYDSPLDYRLVRWAHYVVLPAIFTDVAYIIREFRDINPDVEFVMDVDVNYHVLPDHHPENKKLGEGQVEALLGNLQQVDIMTAPNPVILDQYERLTQESQEKFRLFFEQYPNLLSPITYEECPDIVPNTSGKVRLGMVVDTSQREDVQTISEPLYRLVKTYPDKVELVVFGWPPRTARQFGLFTDLPVRYENPVSMTGHYHRLNELAFDIALLPLQANAYNQSGRAFTRYLEFSASMVPTIAPRLQPFTQLVSSGETGFLAASGDEWYAHMAQLVRDESLRKEVGMAAFRNAWERHSYTRQALQRLVHIFE